jgi:hypothetical protein
LLSGREHTGERGDKDDARQGSHDCGT